MTRFVLFFFLNEEIERIFYFHLVIFSCTLHQSTTKHQSFLAKLRVIEWYILTWCLALILHVKLRKMTKIANTLSSYNTKFAFPLVRVLLLTISFLSFLSRLPTPIHGLHSQSRSQSTTMSRTKLQHQAIRVRAILQQRNANTNGNGNGNTSARTRTSTSTIRILKVPGHIPSSKQLYFPSSYSQKNGSRGFCNWLIPNHVMIGQYPGMTPEKHGPTEEEAKVHVNKMVNDARIRAFYCLQSEVPSQDDYESWNDVHVDGKVQLPIDGGRRDFPGYFTHYAPLVELALDMGVDLEVAKGDRVSYNHSPILDLNTPSSSSLVSLLSTILTNLECENSAVYIHCWGGRGRAGLVGSCLLSILFPELTSKECLDWVQRGYGTRDGAMFMPLGLRQSPQTSSQREFVHQFVADFRR